MAWHGQTTTRLYGLYSSCVLLHNLTRRGFWKLCRCNPTSMNKHNFGIKWTDATLHQFNGGSGSVYTYNCTSTTMDFLTVSKSLKLGLFYYSGRAWAWFYTLPHRSASYKTMQIIYTGKLGNQKLTLSMCHTSRRALCTKIPSAIYWQNCPPEYCSVLRRSQQPDLQYNFPLSIINIKHDCCCYSKIKLFCASARIMPACLTQIRSLTWQLYKTGGKKVHLATHCTAWETMAA